VKCIPAVNISFLALFSPSGAQLEPGWGAGALPPGADRGGLRRLSCGFGATHARGVGHARAWRGIGTRFRPIAPGAPRVAWVSRCVLFVCCQKRGEKNSNKINVSRQKKKLAPETGFQVSSGSADFCQCPLGGPGASRTSARRCARRLSPIGSSKKKSISEEKKSQACPEDAVAAGFRH
jgi:hypothetical protein